MSGGAGDSGYRAQPQGGPTVRTDVVDVYLFRVTDAGSVEFLQLLRAAPPLASTWQPLMGHVERDETATHCALREVREEVGLAPESDTCLGFWALEQVHPFYLPDLDCVVMSPRFALQVAPGWAPALNDEHRDARWVESERMSEAFLWPGQKRACREILEEIAAPDGPGREAMRLIV